MKKKIFTWIVIILVTLILVLCGIVINQGGGNSNPSTMASIQCENFVKNNLKSPSTANFPNLPMITDKGNGTFEVTGYVDAENSFGATLRNFFICDIHYTGGDNGIKTIGNL